MKAVRNYLAVAALLVTAAPAVAQVNPAFQLNAFVTACRNYNTENNTALFDQGFCAGVIYGVVRSDPEVCQPQGWTLAQAVQIVSNMADKIPEAWHKSLSVFVAETMRATWPCRTQTPSAKAPTQNRPVGRQY